MLEEFTKVKETEAKWSELPWSEITEEIDKMMETNETQGRDCTRLPGILKSWPAYAELKQSIEEKELLLPLVKALAKDSIRDRHWEEIIERSGVEIPFQSETFNLQQLFAANLLSIQEEIEEITENADKQLKLEFALDNEIAAFWDEMDFCIEQFNHNGKPSKLTGNIEDIKEKLEEHILMLNQSPPSLVEYGSF